MIECKNCGEPIYKGHQRLILTIHGNPSFCCEKCFDEWTEKNIATIKEYAKECLTTKANGE